MKKKIIELSRWHVAAFIFLAAGILLLLWGVVAWYKLRAAVNISMLDIEDLRTGKYVKGEITQYAVKEIDTVNGTKFYGVSASCSYGITFYDVFTVPVLNDDYISVLIKDEPLQDRLESYNEGKGSGAYFVGRVEKPRYDINYNFWSNSTGFSDFDNAADAKEKICDEYVIRQIYPDRIRYRMFAGLSLIVTAFIGFNAKGGIWVKDE